MRIEERRSVPFDDVELREASDGLTFHGYAAPFDSETDLGPYRETIERGAFGKTLADGADVRMLVNHEGIPLARTRSRTLKLREDKRGLLVEAKLDPNNPRAQELMSAMRRKDLDQMSFAFRAIQEIKPEDNDGLRVLKEVELFDVSPVTYPAYEDTTAEMRQRQIELLGNYAHSLGITIRTDPEDPPAEPEPEPIQADHSLVLARQAQRKRKDAYQRTA
jgi:HK97 family phage prohead protease